MENIALETNSWLKFIASDHTLKLVHTRKYKAIGLENITKHA